MGLGKEKRGVNILREERKGVSPYGTTGKESMGCFPTGKSKKKKEVATGLRKRRKRKENEKEAKTK